MRTWLALAASILFAASGSAANAQGAAIPDLPRNETLIVENPEGTIKTPGWFNLWAVNRQGQSTGLHQLALDTLWYIDPDYGLNGVWDNSLASEPPIYNDDFTQMTVKLREGIFWSDGVEFTSADLAFTVQTAIDTDGMRWTAPFRLNVESIEVPDRNTVVFKLKKPNSRFHALFTVRWNAVWMMPKHIFEKVADPLQFDFNPPVSLGAYTLRSFDPNGAWYIWEKRPDWQRTTLARFGEPGPKYVAYVDPGPPDKRVIAQMNHNLDIIHDVSPEGMFTLAKDSPSSKSWFEGFPYAHPDPTLPAVIFNTQLEKFSNPDVRWALALLIDIKAVSMASYRGAATISAIAIPPTGTHPDFYHKPMQDWLASFEIDTGKRKIKPYDPTAGQQIADMLRPSMGDQIPTDPEEIGRSFGLGWWKPDPGGGGGAAGEGRLHQAGRSVADAGRAALRRQGDGRGRAAARHDAGGRHHRAGVAAVRHRRLDGRGRGHHAGPSQRRRLRRDDGLERGDLGRPSRPVVLPRQLALLVRRRAGREPAVAQLAALEVAGARQDHRGDPHHRLRRQARHRARSGVHQADGPRHADHPDHVLQRLHGDG